MAAIEIETKDRFTLISNKLKDELTKATRNRLKRVQGRKSEKQQKNLGQQRPNFIYFLAALPCMLGAKASKYVNIILHKSRFSDSVGFTS